MVFAGEQFENDADFKLAKSMLLDMFRGRVVEKINLKVLQSWRHCMAPSALTSNWRLDTDNLKVQLSARGPGCAA